MKARAASGVTAICNVKPFFFFFFFFLTVNLTDDK